MAKFYDYPPATSIDGTERTVIEQEGEARTADLDQIVSEMVTPAYVKPLISQLSLDVLSDVEFSSPQNGDNMVYIDGTWTNGAVSVSALGDIGDVNLSGQTNGDVLIYFGGNWINSVSPVLSLGSVGDVQIDAPSLLTGSDILIYSSSKWRNLALGVEDLNDVNINVGTLADGQTLVWATSEWVNSGVSLENNSDVVINPLTLLPNQTLKYNGTKWVNADALSLGLFYSGVGSPPSPFGYQEGSLYITYV